MTEAFVETVVTALRRVLDNPQDELGRSQLSWCSALALSGVLAGREGGWPMHALEHGLSAWTDVAHGRGLAMLLPRLMAFDAAVIPDKIIDFNARVFGTTVADPWNALEQGLFAFMREVGAWTSLDELRGDYSTDELAAKVVDHALEVSGVWKRGEQPYLDNCKPIDRDAGLALIKAQF
jgi:alcohol dehydrogenase YqhD (iron-dependent ADH family)